MDGTLVAIRKGPDTDWPDWKSSVEPTRARIP